MIVSHLKNADDVPRRQQGRRSVERIRLCTGDVLFCSDTVTVFTAIFPCHVDHWSQSKDSSNWHGLH